MYRKIVSWQWCLSPSTRASKKNRNRNVRRQHYHVSVWENVNPYRVLSLWWSNHHDRESGKMSWNPLSSLPVRLGWNCGSVCPRVSATLVSNLRERFFSAACRLKKFWKRCSVHSVVLKKVVLSRWCSELVVQQSLSDDKCPNLHLLRLSALCGENGR